MELHKRLRLLREESGMLQKDMAEKFNMPRPTYNGYETGKREPDLALIKAFAEYFNVSIDYITGKTDIKNESKNDALVVDGIKLDKIYIGMAKDLQVNKISPTQLQKIIELLKEERENKNE
ncbi:MAG: helix-turn-helix transcriptional regulator [Candidatus Magnetobacterium sp. LHC-1]